MQVDVHLAMTLHRVRREDYCAQWMSVAKGMFVCVFLFHFTRYTGISAFPSNDMVRHSMKDEESVADTTTHVIL